MRRIAGLLLLVVACKSPSATEPATGTGTETGTETETETTTETETATETGTEAETETGTATANPFLDAHNLLRAKHCAPALSWSADLERVARAWATELKQQGCAFEHSSTRYGENLAANTEGALTPADVTAMWYAELSKYDFKHPGFSMATGHFTQLVWAGTRSLGCATVSCNGMDLWVCNYDPPGNVEGGYQRNVQPTTCR